MGSEYYRFGGASNENNKEKKNKGGGGKAGAKNFRGICRAAVFCPGPKKTIRKKCESFF